MNYFVFFYRDFINYLRKYRVKTGYSLGYKDHPYIINSGPSISLDIFNSEILMYCHDDIIKELGIKNNFQCLHYTNPTIRNVYYRNPYNINKGNERVIMFVKPELFIDHILEHILTQADKNIFDYLNSIESGINIENTYQIKSGIVNTKFKFCLEINHDIVDIDEYDKSLPSFDQLFKYTQGEGYWYEIQNLTKDYYFVMKISDRNLKVLKMTSQWDLFSNVVLEKYTNNIEQFMNHYQEWSDFPYKEYLYERLTQ